MHALGRDSALRSWRRQQAETRTRVDQLSRTEFTVRRELVEGRQNKRIASELDPGLRTVELHGANLLKTIGSPRSCGW